MGQGSEGKKRIRTEAHASHQFSNGSGAQAPGEDKKYGPGSTSERFFGQKSKLPSILRKKDSFETRLQGAATRNRNMGYGGSGVSFIPASSMQNEAGGKRISDVSSHEPIFSWLLERQRGRKAALLFSKENKRGTQEGGDPQVRLGGLRKGPLLPTSVRSAHLQSFRKRIGRNGPVSKRKRNPDSSREVRHFREADSATEICTTPRRGKKREEEEKEEVGAQGAIPAIVLRAEPTRARTCVSALGLTRYADGNIQRQDREGGEAGRWPLKRFGVVTTRVRKRSIPLGRKDDRSLSGTEVATNVLQQCEGKGETGKPEVKLNPLLQSQVDSIPDIKSVFDELEAKSTLAPLFTEHFNMPALPNGQCPLCEKTDGLDCECNDIWMTEREGPEEREKEKEDEEDVNVVESEDVFETCRLCFKLLCTCNL